MQSRKIKVEVERIEGYCNLPMLVGDRFYLRGSQIEVPEDSKICMWALQSMMPIFPLLNVRGNLDETHWAKDVKYFSCPDPKGRVIFKLEVVENG